jgi:dipeptidyl aminopeptidase/acylaminoacyl peptidase
VDWSPNSRYLLIYAGPVGDKDIFQINVATGDYTQLTDGGNNAAASYSPDGQYIAFNSLRNDDQADLYDFSLSASNLAGRGPKKGDLCVLVGLGPEAAEFGRAGSSFNNVLRLAAGSGADVAVLLVVNRHGGASRPVALPVATTGASR